MRKLASIQKILDLQAIENADAIEKATVLGWNLVVKKNEFKIGDKVIYCEIDSVLPERPEFEFLKARSYRIKTAKLRGQISQGICFPLELLNNYLTKEQILALEEGFDVTEILGVKKFEMFIPADMQSKVKGDFPAFISKTDETRLQSIPKILEDYQGIKCFITEKVDGSSMTVYFKDGEFGVCSRNLDLFEDNTGMFWKVARNLNLEEKLKIFAEKNDLKNIALQGELIGPAVQGNKYGLENLSFMVFNIFDIDKFSYLSFKDFNNLLEKIELSTVPVVDTDFTLNHSVDDLVELSKGYSLLNKKVKREGIVIRPLEEINNVEEIGRLSFKVINPDFLLKYNE